MQTQWLDWSRVFQSWMLRDPHLGCVSAVNDSLLVGSCHIDSWPRVVVGCQPRPSGRLLQAGQTGSHETVRPRLDCTRSYQAARKSWLKTLRRRLGSAKGSLGWLRGVARVVKLIWTENIDDVTHEERKAANFLRVHTAPAKLRKHPPRTSLTVTRSYGAHSQPSDRLHTTEHPRQTQLNTCAFRPARTTSSSTKPT